MNTTFGSVDLSCSRIATILGLLAMLILAASPAPSLGTLGLIGVPESELTLVPEESAAYDWAARFYDVEYLSLESIRANPERLSKFTTLWWHYGSDLHLPTVASDPAVAASVHRWVSQGGNLMLSGFAPQWVEPLRLGVPLPSTIARDPRDSGPWGLNPRVPDHPIFRDLPRPIVLISEGIPVENHICWWDAPEVFTGAWLADLEWDAGKVACGEITLGAGKVLVIGVGAFDWHTGNRANVHRRTLEVFAANCFSYLGMTVQTGQRKTAAIWHADPSAAFRRAAAEEKPLVVLFCSNTSKLCDEIMAHISVPRYSRVLTEKGVCSRLDVALDDNKPIIDRYKIHRVPTLLFFNPQGRVIARIDGHRDFAALDETFRSVFPEL